MSEGAPLITEQGELLSHIFEFVFASTLEMNKLQIFLFVAFQTCNNHRGCHRRCGARPHPAGPTCLLPKKTEEAKEEGNTEEDPARTRGGSAGPT